MRFLEYPSRGLLVVALLCAPCASAGEPPLPVAGSRVRVTAAGAGQFSGIVTGTLLKATADAMIILDGERGGVLELPTGSITRVEVSHGRHRHARLGLALGAALGLAAGFSIASDPKSCGFDQVAPCTASNKVFDVIAGALVYGGGGAFIGHKIRTETWSDTPLESPRVTVTPVRRGARLGVTVSF